MSEKTIITVGNCGSCPFYYDSDVGGDGCGHPDASTVLVEFRRVPDHCPLRERSALVVLESKLSYFDAVDQGLVGGAE